MRKQSVQIFVRTPCCSMARDTLSGSFDFTPLLWSRSVAQDDRVFAMMVSKKIFAAYAQ
jgi:hypothetical protein